MQLYHINSIFSFKYFSFTLLNIFLVMEYFSSKGSISTWDEKAHLSVKQRRGLNISYSRFSLDNLPPSDDLRELLSGSLHCKWSGFGKRIWWKEGLTSYQPAVSEGWLYSTYRASRLGVDHSFSFQSFMSLPTLRKGTVSSSDENWAPFANNSKVSIQKKGLLE